MSAKQTLNAALRLAAACLLAALLVSLAACSTDTSADGDASDATSSEAASASATTASADDTSTSLSTATFTKGEVIYASLSAAGEPQELYVVNSFDVESSGTIVDFGAYDSVARLTSENALASNGDTVTFEADEGTVYYQGNTTEAELPWVIDITYELDGVEVAAADLAGASGTLSIHVTTQQNEAVEETSFYECFMLQITFTMPGDAVSEIEADGATIAASGSDTTVAFTTLPGSDGDFTLSAEVENFTMDGVQIVGLPYSSVIDMPDTDELTSSLTELSEAIEELAEGTDELAEGTDELASGMQEYADGTITFAEALATFSSSGATLASASSQINSALSTIASSLDGVDLSQLDSLSQLSELASALEELASGLTTLQENAAALQQGYDQALSVLDAAIDAIPDATLSESDIASLYALAYASGTADDVASLDELVEAYQAAATVKQTYAALEEAFTGASTLLATLGADASSGGALATSAAALEQMAASLDAALDADSLSQLSSLSELVSALESIAESYASFDEGLAQYAAGAATLASSYTELSEGADTLADGTSELADGTSELADGTNELNDATITLPDELSEQIEELMADYDFPEFDPVSFMSASNDTVTDVQFVMTTEAIELPEEEEVAEEEEDESFFDRLVALFS